MVDYSALRKITIDDIPEAYREVAETIGLDVFIEVCRYCNGNLMYLPRIESLERKGRDREICARFDGGNYKQLAKMFRLSERRIRAIVNAR